MPPAVTFFLVCSWLCILIFSELCAEATLSIQGGSALHGGDEAQAQQLQERTNERKIERAKNLPSGTAVIQAPTYHGFQGPGILFTYGFKTVTSPAPKDLKYTFKWHCCSSSDCTLVCPLGEKGKSQTSADKHLKITHSIIGQQPGTVVDLQNSTASCVDNEVEEAQIGAPRVKHLNLALTGGGGGGGEGLGSEKKKTSCTWFAGYQYSTCSNDSDGPGAGSVWTAGWRTVYQKRQRNLQGRTGPLFQYVCRDHY